MKRRDGVRMRKGASWRERGRFAQAQRCEALAERRNRDQARVGGGSGTPRTHHGRGRTLRLPRDGVASVSPESPILSEVSAPSVARDMTAPTLEPSPEIGANRSRIPRRSRTRVARDAPRPDPRIASLPCRITGTCASRLARDIPTPPATSGSSAAALAHRRAPRRDRAGVGPTRLSGRGSFGRLSRRPAAGCARRVPP
jgi:hypothetical protein